MQTIKRFLIFSVIIAVVLSSLSAVSYIYGKYTAQQEFDATKPQITSQIIIDKINDQYFLVTKTLFFDEETKIEIKQDSKFNDLLWGQTIDASGVIRIDVGVDMISLKPEDVIVDDASKTITIYLPEATVLDSSLSGDLEINTKDGIFKSLFQNDEGEDYNLAVRELIKLGNDSVNAQPELLNEAKEDSKNLIKIILSGFEYEVIFE